jgi:hypothetical protein
MKPIYALFLVVLLSCIVSAQVLADASVAPDIEVIEKEWYMEVNNPAFEKSPFGPIEELQQTRQTRRVIQRQNEIRARRGLPPLRTPTPQAPEPDPSSGKSPDVFTYKLKVKNTGQKTIQTIIWDYVFLEPGTEHEVGRQQFLSEGKINPGKTKNISVSSLSPPSNSINVKVTGKKMRDQYSEKIIIQAIEFTDGTFWHAEAKE